MVFIVGLGPGHRDYILNKAREVLKKCDYIIGFKRAMDSLNFIENKKIYIKRLSEINKFIEEDSYYIHKDIAIVASGDPTFYGILNYIKENTKVSLEVVPGISSFQYLTSKMRVPWNNAFLGSLHGRECDFLGKVRENDISIWLTDKENTPAKLCNLLYQNNIDCSVIIGENLSYEDEVINTGKPEEFINKEFSVLNIFIVKDVNA